LEDIRLVVKGTHKEYFLTGLTNFDVLEKHGGLKGSVAEGYCANAVSADAAATSEAATEAKEGADQRMAPLSSVKSENSAEGSDREAPEAWFDQYEPIAAKSLCRDKAAEDVEIEQGSGEASPLSPANNATFIPSGSFIETVEVLPDDTPAQTAAIFQVSMRQATIEGIRKALSINKGWPMRLFLEEHLKITEAQESSWARSERIPGTRVRRLRFRMPVPADVPQSVKRLISLPETSQVTLLARLGCSSDRVVLVQEICTHDVTYGENFWVRDILVFHSDPSGGVLFEKFTTIRWVVGLPWYASVLGTYIEMKAKEDSKNAGVFFAKYLQRECGM
jgi:hypothetical protein